MKKVAGLLFFVVFIVLMANCHNNRTSNIGKVSSNDSAILALLKQKGLEAKKFCATKKMNTKFCVLANMHIHSGKIRIYVWDFSQQKAIDSGLVSHGCGANPWSGTTTKESPIFSNEDGSHCSALGKYKIGSRGYSQWGININYLLHGLEASNSNALIRQVVLHSWDVVSENPIYPAGTPEGWGCPAVSNLFMKRLDNLLKQEKTSVLLWTF